MYVVLAFSSMLAAAGLFALQAQKRGVPSSVSALLGFAP